MHIVTLLPEGRKLSARHGANLLEVLRGAGTAPESPCGGHGTCGKCRVLADGTPVLACQCTVERDMEVFLGEQKEESVLTAGAEQETKLLPFAAGLMAAFDIGTTTVVCYLLDGETGEELACESRLNPQKVFGADVISRIRAAMDGHMEELTGLIREALNDLLGNACKKAGKSPADTGVIAVVGNPCMQQLFLGLEPSNLAAVPFSPVLTEAGITEAQSFFPGCPAAKLLTVPDISGYVGADTLGCVLSSGMYCTDKMTLMVDIGTNGEMVLGNSQRMTACSAAAGPALEGANIQFGMRGTRGAIDHVWIQDQTLHCSVIGEEKAVGICGSGLIDAVAAALELGLINKRGRIADKSEKEGRRYVPLTEEVWLTQDDIRQVQLAKGAIAAGIQLMCAHLGISQEDIEEVLLAGAFGSFLSPKSACRIGLLPGCLEDKVTVIGNAAGSGARMLCKNRENLELTEKLAREIEFLELASLPEFQRCFGKNTGL